MHDNSQYLKSKDKLSLPPDVPYYFRNSCSFVHIPSSFVVPFCEFMNNSGWVDFDGWWIIVNRNAHSYIDELAAAGKCESALADIIRNACTHEVPGLIIIRPALTFGKDVSTAIAIETPTPEMYCLSITE
jgi:hypothetical protein